MEHYNNIRVNRATGYLESVLASRRRRFSAVRITSRASFKR